MQKNIKIGYVASFTGPLAAVGQAGGEADALEAEAAITRDPAALLGLWHRIGEVYERRIHDPAAAARGLRRVCLQ